MFPLLAIHAENLHKHIKTGLRRIIRAVDGISLDIIKGEVFGILGPNGAGKTTLFRLMAGLLRPSEGTVTTLGQDPWQNHVQVTGQIGYLTENHGSFEELTVLENLYFFGKVHRISNLDDRIDELIIRLSLEEKLDEKVAKLSKGMKQRLALARCFIHDGIIISLADKEIHDAEISWLKEVAQINGIENILDDYLKKMTGSTAEDLENNLDVKKLNWG